MPKYDEQFKLKIVQEYLNGSAGSDTLAMQYGVPRSMVKKWVGLYRAHGREGLKRKHGSSYSAEFKLSVLQHMWTMRCHSAKQLLRSTSVTMQRSGYGSASIEKAVSTP